MLNYPENYTEARKILIDAVDNDLEKKKLKITKLRTIFITAVGLGVSTALGVTTKDPLVGLITFPNAMLISLPLMIPYFARAKATKKIKDHSYFREHTPDEIIESANDYVTNYNKWEESQNMEGKSK